MSSLFSPEWKSKIEKKKIYWDKAGSLPFIKAADDVCLFECHFGPDRDASRKDKRRKEVVVSGSTRRKGKTSKKMGCEAKIIVEERIYFLDFEIKVHS